jgi:hypothetical protein
MTASYQPNPEIALETLGAALERIAKDLKEECAITKVHVYYQGPVEALDVASAVLVVWIDGDHDKAIAVRSRLNQVAREEEWRLGLPERSGGVIVHWLV